MKSIGEPPQTESPSLVSQPKRYIYRLIRFLVHVLTLIRKKIFTFATTFSFTAVNSQPQKTNPSPSSFLSLPDVIILNCFARISRSYYPKLSLVCKTFRSLFLSNELNLARFHHKTIEEFYHVRLQFPDQDRPSWFTLWIKPGQTLTNDLKKKKKSTGNTRLVPIPSSYSPFVPHFIVQVGSECYALRQYHPPSAVMLVRNVEKELSFRCLGPRMTVARESAVACVLDRKIYVMGGCAVDESKNWGEVFDLNTQTWEPLPDPGVELRFSSIKKIEVIQGKIYVTSTEKKRYVYDPKEVKWDVAIESLATCLIENVWYCCDGQSCFWYDEKRGEWRQVQGLANLNKTRQCGVIEVANYRGKFLVLWDKFVCPNREYKDIWCAMIVLERRNDDEIWGSIKWANVVLTVPCSYVFLRCRLTQR